MATSYTEQFERMKRYFNRFRAINDGQVHTQPSPYYDDDVYAFFQHCYHLKDWIKNDPAFKSWNSDIEDFINKNSDLRICADLCNALKHVTLTKKRSTVNPSFAGGSIGIHITEGLESVNISIKYNVSTLTGDIDAFELAERCVKAWEQYISANASSP